MTRTTRRRLLGAIATAGVVGTAGCLRIRGRRRPTPQPGAAGRPGPLPATADATFRGDLRNRGYFPDQRVPDAVEVEWTLPINRGDHTAAKASAVPAGDPGGGADGDGRTDGATEAADGPDLIWPGDTGELRRVTAEGEVVWTADTRPSTRGIHGTPTVAGDTVYVGAYDGALYAVDLATGERRWRTPLGDAIGSSPVYHRGVVYVAVEYIPPDGAVFAVDARTGEVRDRSHRPTDHPHSTIGIDPEAGVLTVGSNDGVLYGWEYPSLEPAWQFETGDAIKGPVAVHKGLAVVGSWDHRVYGVDLATGDRAWEYETDDLVMSGPSIDLERDRAYVGSHDGGLYALDLATGERLWRFDARGTVLGCPVVTGDRVLFGSYADSLWAIDRETGARDWRVRTDGWVTATPRVVDGRVYVAERAPRGSDGPPGDAHAIGARG